LRYGTPPIVRGTGGLADTIIDATDANLEACKATGFRFQAYTPQVLLATIRRALDMYHNQPEQFLHLIRCCMRQDWSWDRSARGYEEIYQRLVAERDRTRR
jgi:starch synthase